MAAVARAMDLKHMFENSNPGAPIGHRLAGAYRDLYHPPRPQSKIATYRYVGAYPVTRWCD